MKNLTGVLFAMLLVAVPMLASAESAPAAPTAVAAADAPAATPAAPAAAPAAAPVPNKGDTAWMIVATVLVILMTIPGLALFYGGLVRSKNMLSVLMQVFTIFCLVAVLWVVYGYSMAFSAGGGLNSFIGGLDKLFMKGITPDSTVETFSKGVVIPEYIFVMFQLTFAAITTALITGAYAERIKFSAVLVFSALWFTFSYLPISHMVWFWGGPSAPNDPAGFLFAKGALDFAGGTVVHINAGIAGLMGARVLGKRLGYPKTPMPPHSLTMTMIGACMLWVGWFGFNVGSNLEATGTAALAFFNTLFATAVAALTWTFVEWMAKGKPSLLGGVSGAVAGLVAITPAAGFVGPMGALVIGAVAGVGCLWAVSSLKRMLGYDDALDVFGVHCIGGIIGAIGTGIFVNPKFGGTGVFDYVANKVGDFDAKAQIVSQLWAVGTSLVWSAVVAFVLFKLIDIVMGLRVSEEAEREGLDVAEHGEKAYNM
ncbi:MAG: ammonium transporter [Pseudomonadota bacterium]|mgnify:FL=1